MVRSIVKLRVAILIIGFVAIGGTFIMFSFWKSKPKSSQPLNTNQTSLLPADWLVEATELAGYFAAHAVWSVSDGETLIPLVGFEDATGARRLHRFASDQIEIGVAEGEKWLQANPDGAKRAVFIFDGYITLDSGKSDALIIKVRDFTHNLPGMQWAIPYRPANSPDGFAVHRPKAIYETQEGRVHAVPLGEALWRGIEAHQQGAEVWNKHLDESK